MYTNKHNEIYIKEWTCAIVGAGKRCSVGQNHRLAHLGRHLSILPSPGHLSFSSGNPFCLSLLTNCVRPTHFT